MKNRLLIIALVVLLAICLAGGYWVAEYWLTMIGSDYRNITDLTTAYNADYEIREAHAKLQQSSSKATIITSGNRGRREIALTFDGLTDRSVIQRLLDLLERYDAKATFFVDGIQTAEDPAAVIDIKRRGHKIANYTLHGLVRMETLAKERLVQDFCRAQKIITVTTDIEPTLLKCNATKYTDQLLRIVSACGFKSVVQSTAFVNIDDVQTPAAADEFVRGLSPGNIVSLKLKPNVDPIIYEHGKTDERPAIDKQPGLKELSPENPEAKPVVVATEMLLQALKKAHYSVVYIEANPPAGTLSAISRFWQEIRSLVAFPTAHAAGVAVAEEIKLVYTTDPAVAFSFSGIAHQDGVADVLARLDKLGIRATFFITMQEMARYPQTIGKIIARQHELGIAILPKPTDTAAQTRQAIVQAQQTLAAQYGVRTDLVKQPWGGITEATKSAVAGLNCKLIGQSLNVVQTKHRDVTSAEQIMQEVFKNWVIALARGQILHFRLDFYTHRYLTAELVELVKQQKVDNVAYATVFDNPFTNPANNSQYVIKPVGDLLNSQRGYRYPVGLGDIPAALRYAEPKAEITKLDVLRAAADRYIGHPHVTYADRMVGFSKMEARRLDTSGLVHTDSNVIFLTFDDWGSDAVINQLLYVLRKHQVPGTFFVITRNVLLNPNLLRAIAQDGHDIACHSDQHVPMVERDPLTNKQYANQDNVQYSLELQTAYEKLRDVVGDVVINGKPALTRFFRPPTLAISKEGLSRVFAAGYEYIVSGSCSTEDYRARDARQLIDNFKLGIYIEKGEVKKGAILIMHMGDSCALTPIALDILLTANAAKADNDPTKFKVGRLSDYLVPGYSQRQPDASKKLQAVSWRN